MPTTKHLRFSVDFSVEIADRPPEHDELNEYDPAYHGRQIRLLNAVKGNPAVLNRWLRSLVVDEMMAHSGWDWDDLIFGGEFDTQKELMPALATLSEEDQEYFQDLGDLDFSDITDLFQASFTVVESPPLIVEV